MFSSWYIVAFGDNNMKTSKDSPGTPVAGDTWFV